MASIEGDPRTWKEALSADNANEWRKGYEEEMNSLRAHKVWTLVPKSEVPTGRRIVASKPHFVQKRDEKGEVIHRKVRVVAKGFK